MNRRAFTLLEVMLALGILMALLAVMAQFTWSLGQGQRGGRDRRCLICPDTPLHWI